LAGFFEEADIQADKANSGKDVPRDWHYRKIEQSSQGNSLAGKEVR